MVPAVVADRITREVPIPTIGIGAGPDCDGEVQVFHDIMGLHPGEPYKHTRRFLNAYEAMTLAAVEYAKEVRDGTFPTKDNSF
jgi:3-methyl-2-oxobutanoate hydroxymethyltransferase